MTSADHPPQRTGPTGPSTNEPGLGSAGSAAETSRRGSQSRPGPRLDAPAGTDGVEPAAGVSSAAGVGAPAQRGGTGTWGGLLSLALFQVLIGLPILGVAAAIGRDHLDQAMLAAAVVWPLVLLSYGPLLLANTPSILVPMYLGMMIRMFGTTASVVAMRQIAAPLAPDSWFIYISAFYLAGLAAETSWVVASLKRCPKLPKIERKA